MIYIALLIPALLCACALLLLRKRLRLNTAWALLAVAAAAAACLLCAAGLRHGTLYARFASRPEEAVTGFFDSLVSGEYERAYPYLDNYTDLGLQREPEDEQAALLYGALRRSWSYTPVGEAQLQGLNAQQQVDFTCLDVSALQGKLQEQVYEELEGLVDRLPYDEVYDETQNYRPEVTERAYRMAVNALLGEAADLTRTQRLTVSLRYDGSAWRIQADSALLSALSGFVG